MGRSTGGRSGWPTAPRPPSAASRPTSTMPTRPLPRTISISRTITLWPAGSQPNTGRPSAPLWKSARRNFTGETAPRYSAEFLGRTQLAAAGPASTTKTRCQRHPSLIALIEKRLAVDKALVRLVAPAGDQGAAVVVPVFVVQGRVLGSGHIAGEPLAQLLAVVQHRQQQVPGPLDKGRVDALAGHGRRQWWVAVVAAPTPADHLGGQVVEHFPGGGGAKAQGVGEALSPSHAVVGDTGGQVEDVPGLQGPACGWGEAVQQLELGALPQWGGLVAQRADGPVAPPRALNQEHIVIVEMG